MFFFVVVFFSRIRILRAHCQIHNGGKSRVIRTTTDPLKSRFLPQNGAGLSMADRPLPSQLI